MKIENVMIYAKKAVPLFVTIIRNICWAPN